MVRIYLFRFVYVMPSSLGQIISSTPRNLFTKISWRRMTEVEESARAARLRDEEALVAIPDLGGGGDVAGPVTFSNGNV